MGNIGLLGFLKTSIKHPCLGPLRFHDNALGTQLTLNTNGQYAERNRETFQNGLAFINRPIGRQERIHIRVERCDQHWDGAMRVGFTVNQPSSFDLSLNSCILANPHSTANDGYWARALPTSHTRPGAELCFWVTPRGEVKYKGPDGVKYTLMDGVEVTKPLWAIIDVYGQTRAVLLLGSEKKGWSKQKCCPVAPPPPASNGDSCMCVDKGQPCRTPQDFKHHSAHIAMQSNNCSGPNSLEGCVVCLSAGASVTLPCGHHCLCSPCASRITVEFRTCPLCRHPI